MNEALSVYSEFKELIRTYEVGICKLKRQPLVSMDLIRINKNIKKSAESLFFVLEKLMAFLAEDTVTYEQAVKKFEQNIKDLKVVYTVYGTRAQLNRVVAALEKINYITESVIIGDTLEEETVKPKIKESFLQFSYELIVYADKSYKRLARKLEEASANEPATI